MTAYLTMIIIAVLVGALLLWVYKCFNILGPSEMAIKTFLGLPAKKGVDSGPRWIWWPLQKLNRYTKEQMAFYFTAKTVVTPKGKLKNYGEIEAVEIDIFCGIFAYFDRKNLKKTIEQAPGNTAKAIGEPLMKYAIDSVRALGGRVPWRLINEERHHSANWILGRMVGGQRIPVIKMDEERNIYFDTEEDNIEKITPEQLEQSSPFVQFGLKQVSFIIEDINFKNKDLKAAISAPETERLNKAAAKEKADAERYTKEQVGYGEAEARSAMLQAIQENPDFEVLRAMEEMAKGSSNTIMYQLPVAFENKVRDMLGGNSVTKAIDMLGPESKKKLEAYVTSLLKSSK